MAGAFADSKGRYGYRRIKAVLKTGVSEKVVRRIMAEEGLVAHVPKRRRYGSYEGETTPAPANLVDRDFTAERPNEKWLTCFASMFVRQVRQCFSVVWADGFPRCRHRFPVM